MADNMTEKKILRWQSLYRGHRSLGSLWVFSFVCCAYLKYTPCIILRLIFGFLILAHTVAMVKQYDRIKQAMTKLGKLPQLSKRQKILHLVFTVAMLMVAILVAISPFVPIIVKALIWGCGYYLYMDSWLHKAKLKEEKMKKTFQRIFGLLLTLCLLVGTLAPVQAFAAETTEGTTTEGGTETPPAEGGELPPTEGETPPEGGEPEPPADPVTIQSIRREHEAWAKEVRYTVTLGGDTAQIAAVTLQHPTGETALAPTPDGSYCATITENGAYTVIVTDTEGQTVTASFEETMIDLIAPAVSVQPADTGDTWTLEHQYTVIAGDLESGIASVTVQPEGGQATPLASAEDGKYSFIADRNTTYTVTAIDHIGNIATVTVTEDRIDREAPVITTPVRQNAGWSQTVQYHFTASDLGSGIAAVVVTTPTGNVTPEAGNGGYSFTADSNGTYTIIVTDALGNFSQISVSEAYIDQTAPEIFGIYTQQEWASNENTVTMTVTDNGSVTSVKITDSLGNIYPHAADGTAYTVVLSKNATYTVTVVDAAGNTASQTFTVDRIDTDAPSKPILDAAGAGAWVNVDVDLTAVAEDTQSGIAGYWYHSENTPFDPAQWQQMELVNGTGLLKLTEDQSKTYYVVAEDHVGRISQPAYIQIAIDKTPSDSLVAEYLRTEGSGYLREVDGRLLFVDKLTFCAKADDSGSGIVRYEYRINGASGTDWIGVDAGSEGFTYTHTGEESLYSVSVRVYDRAGNCSEVYTTAVCILENTHTEDAQRNPIPDVSMQTISGQYGSAWTKDTVTITVTGSQSVSGIEYYEYRVDHADPAIGDTAWTKVPVIGGKATLTADKDSNAVYHFRAVSYAGNISLETSRTVLVQKTAPNAAVLTQDAATGTNGWYTLLPGYQISLPGQGAFSSPVEYRIDCIHDGVLKAQVVYDGSNAPQITGDGVWSFRITAVDAAGNTAFVEASTVLFCVDTEAPTALEVTMDGDSILNITDNDPQWNRVNVLDRVLHSDYTIFLPHSVTITASARGGDSGMAGIYYQVVPESNRYDPHAGWTELEAEGLRLAPNGKYHLYFKAVDPAGNTTYFSGKSLILDDTAPEQDVVLTDLNLSVHGFYKGNVTVDIAISDPAMGDHAAFSGIQSITYRVLRDGQQTQADRLWPGSGEAVRTDGRISAWSGSLVVLGELNNSNDVKLEVSVTDAAGNVTTYTSGSGEIKIDMTAPEIFGSYDRNDPIPTIFEMGCFTGSRVLTVSVTELNFVPAESFVRVIDTDTGREEIYEWVSGEGMTYTVTIPVTADGHYTVTASITDAAGNTTEQIVFAEGTTAGTAFIIDNTPSEIEVSYDNNSAKNELYFADHRAVTVAVTERNFDPAKITAVVRFVAEDGTERSTALSEWQSDGNIHTATMDMTADGTYRLTVTGQDALGNEAKDTVYGGTAPRHWVLDTYMDAPAFSAVTADAAYNGTLMPEITVLDANIDTITMTMIRTRMYEIDKDVTDLLLSEVAFADIAGGRKALLDIFPLEEGMDGQYTLTVNCVDKAGNTASNTIFFYANRFGSVYLYDDYLTKLMDGYFYEINEDIVLTEVNPSGVVDASSTVQITVDGVPVSNPIFTVTPVEVSESGWFEYRYVISKDNFKADGKYEVVVSSKDTAGNIPENTAEDIAIRFAVDTTAPELPNIIGLEAPIVKADSLTVTLSAMDNVMLESITVYLNGEVLEQWERLENYAEEKSFTIPAGLEHTVRIVVVDKVGNTLDTDLESFAPGYEFSRTITVSTNFFLRLYANRPAFYGAVGGTVFLLLGGVTLLIVLVKKRKHSAA